jgi:hypothetical protein
MPQPDAPEQPDPQAIGSPDPARKAGRAMAYSLKCLLDRVRGAREVLPYLASLERGLSAEGSGVLDTIPLHSLHKMGAQLASLPVKPGDLPLRALQVQLLAALERRATPQPGRRERQEPQEYQDRQDHWAGHSTFVGTGRLEVMEVGASQFDAASEAVTGPQGPAGLR